MDMAAATTKEMMLTDNTTDNPTMILGVISTPDEMPTVVDNYTASSEHQPSTAFVTFYIFMRFLFSAVAIFGNTLTIIAVIRFKKLQNNTNVLICNLAVTDLLGCATAPVYLAHTLLSDEPIFVPLCLIEKTMLAVSVLMNLYNMLGIAIDRYLYIVHGLHYPMWVTSTRIYTIVSITWVFVVTEITGIFVSSHQLAVGVPCKFSSCVSKLVYWVLLMPQVGLLSVLTVVFHVAIARIALKQGRAIAALNQPYDTYEAAINRQQKKVMKMMSTVLGAYFACYISQVVCNAIQGSSRTSFWLHYEKVAALIYWANIWLNPLIYAWKNEDFRIAFCNLLRVKTANTLHLADQN